MSQTKRRQCVFDPAAVALHDASLRKPLPENFMTSPFSDDELLAFLDEQLPVERASTLESSLRDSSELRERLAGLMRRRDQGGHTVGEIWRRQRLSCPNRTTLGSYLLGALDDELLQYIEFHLETVGCRLCTAVISELKDVQQARAAGSQQRRRRYFESSAGLLHSDRDT